MRTHLSIPLCNRHRETIDQTFLIRVFFCVFFYCLFCIFGILSSIIHLNCTSRILGHLMFAIIIMSHTSRSTFQAIYKRDHSSHHYLYQVNKNEKKERKGFTPTVLIQRTPIRVTCEMVKYCWFFGEGISHRLPSNQQ